MQSRAPEYGGSSELPPSSNPQTLSAVGGEPAPSASGSAAPVASAAPALVVPRLPGTPDLGKDGLYRFSGAGLELAVDPRSGAALQLSLDGQAVLVAPETDAVGHLSAEVEGSVLVLKSADGALGKRFRLDTARRSVEVTYVVTNTGPRPARSGAHDSHRVASADGLTFFPGTLVALPGRALRLNASPSLVWFPHAQNREAATLEAHAESSEGWVATVNDGLLLVKVFADTAKPSITITAAYDAASKSHPWLEIDEQSAALELAPGASTTTNVRLFLRKLPNSIAVKSGNQELVGFVRGVIQ